MTRLKSSLLALAVAAAVAACASPPCPPGPEAEAFVPADASTEPVPAFCADGRLRRDFVTEAPLFVAPAGAVVSRAPRFNDDGTVDRDPETGSPVYEVVREGSVVLVLVALP